MLGRQKLGRKVGFRYLRAKKSSSFLSIITIISVLGVGVGTLTMVVTLSVMSGFESELKKRLFAAKTHVLIEKDRNYFKYSSDAIEKIKNSTDRIEEVHPVLQTEAILRSGNKVSGAVFKGIGKEQMSWLLDVVTDWADEDLSKEAKFRKIFIGSEMSFDLGVVPGDVVTLISPVESDGPFGAIPRLKKFFVEGIYKTNVPEQEMHEVFTEMKNVNFFLGQKDLLSHIEVKVLTLFEAEEVAAALRKDLGSTYLVRSWQELNSHLFQSLRLERLTMACILIFIIIVATFNIISTLTMMVVEKKKSLSILRAMGATRKQISSIFLWEGMAIGMVGVGTGVGLALIVLWALKQFPIIELPDIYYDQTLPVIIDPYAIGLIVGVAMLVVFFGSLFPARRASDLSPIQGIREG